MQEAPPGPQTGPQTPGPQTPRRRWLVIAISGTVVAVVALVLALTLGGGSDRAPSAHRTVTTTAPVGDHVSIVLGKVSADSVGPPVTITPQQSQQVLDLVDRYVKEATVVPLRSGQPVTGDLSTVFDPAALAKITGADRAIALDEGLPRVTGDLDVVANPVNIVGLGDQGNVVVLTASFEVDMTGPTHVEGPPLHIERRVDFVLSPDAAGAWRVTSYNMVVTRAGSGLDPTTTTASPSSTPSSSKPATSAPATTKSKK